MLAIDLKCEWHFLCLGKIEDGKDRSKREYLPVNSCAYK